MKRKGRILPISFHRAFALVLVGALLTTTVGVGGLESMGNTDGVLTWNLGTIEPGNSIKETVIFAYAGSREKLTALLEQARRDLKSSSESPAAIHETNSPRIVWIRNGVTDFALDECGSFFWEGIRQSLKCVHGGQLSRFGYYVRYNDGAPKRAGTSISKQGALENLRIIEPIRPVAKTQAKGLLDTVDKKVRLGIHAMMGKGPVVAVEFVVTNIDATVLKDLRLSVYSNLEAAHSHPDDYSVLDRSIAGVLVIDPPTGMCAAMAGLTRAAAGQGQIPASDSNGHPHVFKLDAGWTVLGSGSFAHTG